MKARSKNILLAVSCLFLVVSYQNCGKGFTSASSIDANSLADTSSNPDAGGEEPSPSPSPSPTPGPSPGPAPAPSPGPMPGPSPTPNPMPSDPSDQGRRVLKVCPSGCAYTLPSQANAAAQDTDIIEVQAGTYTDCFSVSKNGLKFRGVNGRAHLTTKMCGGKASIVTYANDTVIENFEFSQMLVPDRNGAGIRHQGTGLIVRNSYFHDGENGILSANATADAKGPKDLILVENSRFERMGAEGQAHGVYFGAHRQVTVKNSEFLSSKDQGHEFKTRAMATTIDCSIIASLDGADSYSLNFPDAGQVLVSNSVVQQGNATVNSAIIDYGSEMKSGHTVNTLTFNKVIVINDRSSGGTHYQVRNSTQFKVTDSMSVGPGTMYSVQQGVEQGVQKFTSRNSAGFSASPSLPKPAACTGKIGLL